MRDKIPCKKAVVLRLIPTMLAPVFCLLLFMLSPVVSNAASVKLDQQSDQAIFWAIEKAGSPAGFLLGTIHSEDPRVLDFSEELLTMLNSNTVFAMELVPDLPTLARLAEYMHFPPGKTLTGVIGPGRFEALMSALSGYHVPEDFVDRMKPWAAMMTLSTPPPETGFFMDLSLSLRATGSGLKVVGLETLEQQLSFLEDMPMDLQLNLLDQAIAGFDLVADAHDRMVAAYLENDLVGLQALSNEEFSTVGIKAHEYFVELGINARNIRMLDTLLPHLRSSQVFVAVGALHLPGEKGLLELLRVQGYTLKPLPLPFAPE